MTDNPCKGERCLLPLAMAGWLAKIIEALMPRRVAERWNLASDYSLWLDELSAGRRGEDEDLENEPHSLVAQLMFAILFLIGAILLILTIPLMSTNSLIGNVAAAGLALPGMAALVASVSGGFTEFAVAKARRKFPLAVDVAFVILTTAAWLLFILTIIFGG